MAGVPPNAGPHTISAQVTSGGKVVEVKSHVPVRLDQAGALPLWVDPARAGRLLGMSRTVVYALLDADDFPVPAYKVGRQWRIPTAGILAHLGLQTPMWTCCGCGVRREQHQEVDLGHD